MARDVPVIFAGLTDPSACSLRNMSQNDAEHSTLIKGGELFSTPLPRIFLSKFAFEKLSGLAFRIRTVAGLSDEAHGLRWRQIRRDRDNAEAKRGQSPRLFVPTSHATVRGPHPIRRCGLNHWRVVYFERFSSCQCRVGPISNPVLRNRASNAGQLSKKARVISLAFCIHQTQSLRLRTQAAQTVRAERWVFRLVVCSNVSSSGGYGAATFTTMWLLAIICDPSRARRMMSNVAGPANALPGP